MTTCQRCKSERVLVGGGKVSDMCGFRVGDKHIDEVVPIGLNVERGDYIEFQICLDCGQTQGEWPAEKHEFELEDEDDDNGDMTGRSRLENDDE